MFLHSALPDPSSYVTLYVTHHMSCIICPMFLIYVTLYVILNIMSYHLTFHITCHSSQVLHYLSYVPHICYILRHLKSHIKRSQCVTCSLIITLQHTVAAHCNTLLQHTTQKTRVPSPHVTCSFNMCLYAYVPILYFAAPVLHPIHRLRNLPPHLSHPQDVQALHKGLALAGALLQTEVGREGGRDGWWKG